MVLLHLFTFDPAWLRQRGARRHERSIRDDCEPGAPSAGRAEWLGARVA
jgi:hypothetical protein